MEHPETPPAAPASIAGWLPQAEVLQRLQVSRTTLWRWRIEHGLVSATVGRRVFYSVEGIDALMRRSATEAE